MQHEVPERRRSAQQVALSALQNTVHLVEQNLIMMHIMELEITGLVHVYVYMHTTENPTTL